MRVAIGLDVGTTGSRAIAVDERGGVVDARSAEHPLLTPRPRWTEQDPAAWWRSSSEVLSHVTASCRAAEVVGIGLSGQMHGSVFLDRDFEVIRPALLWNDQRTATPMRRDRRTDRSDAARRDHGEPRAHRVPGAEGALAPR